jgi:hypothetical protein
MNNVPQSILPDLHTTVVIDLSNQTITQSAGNSDIIGSLIVTGQSVTLNLASGTLELSGGGLGTLQIDQPGDAVNLEGGVLQSADVTSGTTLTATNSGHTLAGVQLDGTLDMTANNGVSLEVSSGLTLNGTIKLGSSNQASLSFGASGDTSAQAITGTGSIQFGQGNKGDTLYNVSAGTLIIRPNVTIQAGGSSYLSSSGSGAIDNQGTIQESARGGQFTINAPAWVNDGTIQVSNGATVTLEGQGWSNSLSGQITVTNATLNLYGSWTNFGTITVDPSTVSLGSPVAVAPVDPAAPTYMWSNQGTITLGAGSAVTLGGVFTTDEFEALAPQLLVDQTLTHLTGTLDNSPMDNPVSGGNLTLNASTGPLYLSGGGIYQGTITTSGSNDLVATTQGGVVFGVTLNGTLDMMQFQGASATIQGGLTLNGSIDLGGAYPTPNYADLFFGASNDNLAQTISGTGTIQFGSAFYFSGHGTTDLNSTLTNNSNQTLTFGPSITTQTADSGRAYISSQAGSIDNQAHDSVCRDSRRCHQRADTQRQHQSGWRGPERNADVRQSR